MHWEMLLLHLQRGVLHRVGITGTFPIGIPKCVSEPPFSGLNADDLLQLTYLLQNSLSGNSKVLVRQSLGSCFYCPSCFSLLIQMFLNLSPLVAHLDESLTSLQFAMKVC